MKTNIGYQSEEDGVEEEAVRAPVRPRHLQLRESAFFYSLWK